MSAGNQWVKTGDWRWTNTQLQWNDFIWEKHFHLNNNAWEVTEDMFISLKYEIIHNFYLSESYWWSVVFPLEDLVEMQESRIRWSECKTGFCCAADSRRRLKLCLYGNRFTPNGKVELLVHAGLVWDLYQALTHAFDYKITIAIFSQNAPFFWADRSLLALKSIIMVWFIDDIIVFEKW